MLSGLLASGLAMGVVADESVTEALSRSVTDGSVKLDFRYRYEYVDQADISRNAKASTLRSRITFASAPLHGFNVLAEIDNVSTIGDDDYNSTENGNIGYPVVADPAGTDINQGYIKYSAEEFDGTYGRQRILHSNQRFIGGVAWRQNEQTFDGFRANWKPSSDFSIDYSYVYKVNRIFGPDDGANPAYLRGDNHFLYIGWQLAENHKLGAFGYSMDFDPRNGYAASKTVDNSNETIGVEYSGSFSIFKVKAALARQSDAGANTRSYDANYYMLEGGLDLSVVSLQLGYEVLGAGDGVGFATPLATAHKFQGWADQFLGTPGDGVEDLYAGITGNLGPVKLGAFLHDFQAEDSSEDFGSEVDLVATWPINEQFSTQLKYANFDSDSDRFSDTEKLWFTLQLKL